MFLLIKPYMLKYLSGPLQAAVEDGSIMKTRLPAPDLAALIDEWKRSWDEEWERRCKDYRAYYEAIKPSLPMPVRGLKERIRFHDAKLLRMTSSADRRVEIVIQECFKEKETRLTFLEVKSLCCDADPVRSLCLYEEVYLLETGLFELCLLLESPETGLNEFSIVASGLDIDT